eukprot:3429656-Alexandrium_andersonii.AAC.1
MRRWPSQVGRSRRPTSKPRSVWPSFRRQSRLMPPRNPNASCAQGVGCARLPCGGACATGA